MNDFRLLFAYKSDGNLRRSRREKSNTLVAVPRLGPQRANPNTSQPKVFPSVQPDEDPPGSPHGSFKPPKNAPDPPASALSNFQQGTVAGYPVGPPNF